MGAERKKSQYLHWKPGFIYEQFTRQNTLMQISLQLAFRAESGLALELAIAPRLRNKCLHGFRLRN